MCSQDSCFLIASILAFLTQGVNIAAAILAILFINDFNQNQVIGPYPITSMQLSYPNSPFIYILIAAGISLLILLYFIFQYCMKGRCARSTNVLFFSLLIGFQFGIGVVLAIHLMQNRQFYDYTDQKSNSLNINNIASDVWHNSLNVYDKYTIFYRLAIAATIATFLFGVLVMILTFINKINGPTYYVDQHGNNVIYNAPGTAQQMVPIRM